MKLIYVLIVIVIVCFCISLSVYDKNVHDEYENNIPIMNTQILNNNYLNNLKNNYSKNKIIYIENIFDSDFFTYFKNIAIDESLNSMKKDTSEIFNVFRKATTINGDQITNKVIPQIYHNNNFLNLINYITDNNYLPVYPYDKSSINLLIYDKANDYINWHFDPNHYIGNRITVLVCIQNEGNNGQELSSSKLNYIDINTKEEKSLKMKPNSVLIFDGTKIFHSATGINQDEKRLLLSFTYCDVCKETVYGNFIKNIKELIMGY